MVTVGGFQYRTAPDGFCGCVCTALEALGAVHCFATRIGGVSRGHARWMNVGLNRGDSEETLAENYRRVAAFCQAEPDRFCFTHQVHGDTLRVVDRPDGDYRAAYGVPDCDGLLTDRPDTVLAIVNADCVPILLAAPHVRACAAVHAGWRGTAKGIAKKVVEALCTRYGAEPEELVAAVGPAIGPCCFLTHDDVTDAMAAALPEIAPQFCRPGADGRSHVDLKGINAALLNRAGVSQIFVSEDCTACLPEVYHSHRRDGQLRGTQGAFIGWKGGEER